MRAELDKVSVQSSVQLLKLMKGNPKITAKNIALELDITVRAVEKNIAALKQAGRIKRIGSDKTGSWIVIED